MSRIGIIFMKNKKIRQSFYLIIIVIFVFFTDLNAYENLPTKLDNIFQNSKKVSEDYRAIQFFEQNNDNLSLFQWYLEHINIEEAWKYFSITDSINKPEINIAIVEQGKFFFHPEYENQVGDYCYSDWTEDKPQCGKNFFSKVFYKKSDLDSYYKNTPSLLQKLHKNIAKSKNFISKERPYFLFDSRLENIDSEDTDILIAKNKISEQVSSFKTKDHATVVAGLISSSHNKYGIKGICPFSKIIPYSIFPMDSEDPSEFIKPITYLLDEVQPDVVNLSRGLNFDDTVHEIELWRSASRKYEGKNGEKLKIPVVVAAGHLHPDTHPNMKSIDDQPISDEPFIPVGACTKKKEHSKGTRYGNSLKIYAPGGVLRKFWDVNNKNLKYRLDRSLISTSFLEPNIFIVNDDKYLGGYTLDQSGNSLSVPLVTGTVGLMLKINPLLKFKDIKRILYSSKRYVKIDKKAYRLNKQPKLLDSKIAVIGAFKSIIEDWRKYWCGYPKTTEAGFQNFYNNDSIIVRGVVTNNRVIYDIYSDRQFDIEKEIINPIKIWISDKTNDRMSVTFNKKKSLNEFFKRVRQCENINNNIKVELNLTDTLFKPVNCNLDTINIKFNQRYTVLNKDGSKQLYSDFGIKHFTLTRTSGEWFIAKEIWYYSP